MRLSYAEYQLDFILEENQVYVFSIENPGVYTNMLQDIWKQVQGGQGGFVLSENEKIRNIAKETECIFNPFLLECNDKKIINKLYQDLQEYADVFLLHEESKLNSYILDFLEKLTQNSPYALEYNVNFDVTGLLKFYSVKIESFYDSLLERVIEYIKIMKRICRVNIFIFVDLKHYLAEDDLKHLYEFVFYEKVYIIIIEPVHTKQMQDEKCWIIDQDLCIIEMD